MKAVFEILSNIKLIIKTITQVAIFSVAINLTATLPEPVKTNFLSDENVVTANNDIIIMFENNSISINILNNDYGLDSGIKSLSITTAPTHGSATKTKENTILYSPDYNFVGDDIIKYEVCNNLGSCGSASISIEVLSFDFKPEAKNDTLKINYQEKSIFDILGNDLYLFDLPLSLSIIYDFKFGSSIVTSDLKIETEFTTSFTGLDSLSYQICDNEGDCSIAKLFAHSSNINMGTIIPQGFSPNGDGINDTFYIPRIKNLNNCSITILTRNGTVVYQNPQFKEWDGISNYGPEKGKKLASGVYYYILKVMDPNENIKGYIYLSR